MSLKYGVTGSLRLRENYAQKEKIKNYLASLSSISQIFILMLSLNAIRIRKNEVNFRVMEFSIFTAKSFFFVTAFFSRIIQPVRSTLFSFSILAGFQIYYGTVYIRIIGEKIKNNTMKFRQFEPIFIFLLFFVCIFDFLNDFPIESIYAILTLVSYIAMIKDNFLEGKVISDNIYYLLLCPVQCCSVLFLIFFEYSEHRLFPKSQFTCFCLTKIYSVLLGVYVVQLAYNPQLCFSKYFKEEPKNIFTPTRIEFRDLSEINTDEDKKCLICLEEFCEEKEIFLTYCKHLFHRECLERWLMLKNECPSCHTECWELRETSG